MSLKNRIEKLEKITKPTDEMWIIIRTIVSPGNTNPPLTRLRADDGRTFTREPDETEDDFIHRAARADGQPGRIVRLIAK